MKLSMAVPSPEDTTSYLELEKEYRKIAELGYVAIEPLVNQPNHIGIEKIKEIVDRLNLTISGWRTGLAYSRDGLSFSHPDGKIRREAIRRLKEDIVLASQSPTSILVGMMQGKLDSEVSVLQAKEWIIESLIECADFAQKQEVMVKLEPVSRNFLNYHNTVAEIMDIINRVNNKNLSMLIDIYHMYIEEKSIIDSIKSAQKYISHVHFAGSKRDAPRETGEIDFAEIIHTLKDMRYQGFVAIECSEHLNLLETAESSIRYLLPILQGNR